LPAGGPSSGFGDGPGLPLEPPLPLLLLAPPLLAPPLEEDDVDEVELSSDEHAHSSTKGI